MRLFLFFHCFIFFTRSMTVPFAPFYNDLIKYLPLNNKGQDYVVGDIHGRFDLVEEALRQVNFDYTHDRLLCVGDLIDRGEDSWKVLNFLRKPYVHAVRGNHEDFLLRIYEIESPPEELIAHYAPSMGLQWWLTVHSSIRDLIIAQLRSLPLVMELETHRGQVGFVHAEVEIGYNWGEFKTAIQYHNEAVIHSALWGRKRLTRNFDVPVDGIDRIYVGHTVQAKIRQLGNIVGVDTGAVYDQHLTIANVEVSSKAIDNAQRPEGTIQVIENSTQILTPFTHSLRYQATEEVKAINEKEALDAPTISAELLKTKNKKRA